MGLHSLPAGMLTGLLASLLTIGLVPSPSPAAPKVKITKVTGGLTIPWDVTWVGKTMLIDERSGRLCPSAVPPPPSPSP